MRRSATDQRDDETCRRRGSTWKPGWPRTLPKTTEVRLLGGTACMLADEDDHETSPREDPRPREPEPSKDSSGLFVAGGSEHQLPECHGIPFPL